MRAGRLRHRVAFEAKTITQNPVTGLTVETWSTATVGSLSLASVPAEVLTGPGKEFRAADAVQAEIVARITVRWFAGLDPAWRILWDGKTFNITSIETDTTARHEYRLTCSAGVSPG